MQSKFLPAWRKVTTGVDVDLFEADKVLAHLFKKLDVSDSGLLDFLHEILQDSNNCVGLAAVQTLGDLAAQIKGSYAKREEVLEVLRKATKDENADVRQRAVWALGKLGANDRTSLGVLEKAINDKAPLVRLVAVEIYKKFVLIQQVSLTAFLSVANISDKIPHVVCERVVYVLQEDIKDLVEGLKNTATSDLNDDVRRAAKYALKTLHQ